MASRVNSDWTQMCFPRRDMVFLQTARPIPVAGHFSRACNCWMIKKMCGKCRESMSMPLLCTENGHLRPCLAALPLTAQVPFTPPRIIVVRPSYHSASHGSTARQYARISQELRTKGRPIPQNDMWIAALAMQHQLRLFSATSMLCSSRRGDVQTSPVLAARSSAQRDNKKTSEILNVSRPPAVSPSHLFNCRP